MWRTFYGRLRCRAPAPACRTSDRRGRAHLPRGRAPAGIRPQRERIDFYNDSKATSVDATLKALDAFPGGLWVILGGKDKGLDYSLLRAPLPPRRMPRC